MKLSSLVSVIKTGNAQVNGVSWKKFNYANGGYVLNVHTGEMTDQVEAIIAAASSEEEAITLIKAWIKTFHEGLEAAVRKPCAWRKAGDYCPDVRLVSGARDSGLVLAGLYTEVMAELHPGLSTKVQYRALQWDKPAADDDTAHDVPVSD